MKYNRATLSRHQTLKPLGESSINHHHAFGHRKDLFIKTCKK
ncbi:hypothetical protein [Parapedobacter koreensis]|nr:hypothetical protein [Parapedobacter koreensis]